MFQCEALRVCLVYEKCNVNKVAFPCLLKKYKVGVGSNLGDNNPPRFFFFLIIVVEFHLKTVGSLALYDGLLVSPRQQSIPVLLHGVLHTPLHKEITLKKEISPNYLTFSSPFALSGRREQGGRL